MWTTLSTSAPIVAPSSPSLALASDANRASFPSPTTWLVTRTSRQPARTMTSASRTVWLHTRGKAGASTREKRSPLFQALACGRSRICVPAVDSRDCMLVMFRSSESRSRMSAGVRIAASEAPTREAHTLCTIDAPRTLLSRSHRRGRECLRP